MTMPTNAQNTKPVRIGFIGAGGICRQRHLPGLNALDNIELVAVCNRSQASGQNIADEFGFSEVMTDWKQLLDRDDIDAVFIGSYPNTHAEISCKALDSGKHVFCQARMAATLPDAERMLQSAKDHPELVNMLCPPPHRMPWEAYLLESLASEKYGNLLHVRVVCSNGSGYGPLIFRDLVEFSGQQIMFVGIWAETINTFLGEYQQLSADFSTPIKTKEGEDGNIVEMEIPQVVTINGILNSGISISEYHSGIAKHENLNQIEWITDRGTLRLNAMTSLEWSESGKDFETVQVPENQIRDWMVEADFIQAVRLASEGASESERPVSPDFAEGLKYMKKMAALHLSAKEQRVVKLSEI